MPAVALTDTNGLYAAVQFYKLAQEAGIKAIVGVALDVSRLPELVTRHSPLATSFHKTRNFPSIQLALLAADMEGYSNLCQLVTLRHLGTTKLSQNAAAAENRWPACDIAGIGGAQPRRDRVVPVASKLA